MSVEDLKQLRQQYKLSQQEIADYLGVSRQTIARWESHKTEPQPALYRKIMNLVENGFAEQTQFNKDLTGIWVGYVYQIMKGLPNPDNQWFYYPVILNKYFAGSTVTGNAILYFYTDTNPFHRFANFATEGHIYSETHYKLNYHKAKTINSPIVGSATLILEAPTKLKGTFAGFGHKDSTAIQGEISLVKLANESRTAGLEPLILEQINKTISMNNQNIIARPDIDNEIYTILGLVDSFKR